MQICIPESKPQHPQRQSIIEAKNKIRLGHDECCNCYCCCTAQPTCYKYVQPEVPKSFAPIRYYWKSDIPMDDGTTYRLSYWGGPNTIVEPIRPQDCLTVGDDPISDETTHKASYIGNWCIKPEQPITPCEKQWLGRGPMQDATTQKHDYTWKCVERPEPFKAQQNLYCPPVALSDDTTYRLSYYPSACYIPITSYAPVRKYMKSDVPMEDCTTYKLSYWPNEAPVKEESPWGQKGEYHLPVEPMDSCTTYRLSYWPHCEKRRSPFTLQETENLLNAGCCFDDNTTYGLSYFGCGGDKRDPIKQPENILFSSRPLSCDTVNRLSFLGNWCVKPEHPMTPCEKQMFGRGPMQDVTTQKCDYTWKQTQLQTAIRPENNLILASTPLECRTTHRLSYIPNDHKSLTPIESYAPIRKYRASDVPMESDTTMQLSYQPVESAAEVEKPWSSVAPYCLPITPMEDNTTYNLSYIPPGTLVPHQSCCTPCPILNNCGMPPCQSCPAS
ncbi:hypothetical protein KM043_016291 [Ampulex compressa]|nr:hypothetical protein KM043_016291 [Ampulex compressa]